VLSFSMRQREQFKRDVVSDMIGKVIQSKVRFGLTARLQVRWDHVGMPATNGKMAEKSKGLPSVILIGIKKIVVVLRATFFGFRYALIIAMALVNSYLKYASYTGANV